MSSELIKNLHALNYRLNKSLTIGIHYPVYSSGDGQPAKAESYVIIR